MDAAIRKTSTLVFKLRWNLSADLIVVAASWLLVVGALYSATFLIGREVWGGMGYFLLYALVGAGLFGVGIPLIWTVLIRKRTLADLGITTRYWKRSVLVQLVFSLALYIPAYINTEMPPFAQLLPLIFLSLAIGLFEAIFWRGWVQLRLEEAFGILPSILLASALYAAYHIGYGMPVSEMVFLFFIGLMYAAAFRLTKSILILYPFFQPLGQLKTLITDQLALPTIAALGFGEFLALIVLAIWLVWKRQKKAAQAL